MIVFLICIAPSIKAEILSDGGGDASATNFQVTACIGEAIVGLAGSASSSISCGFLVGPTVAVIVCGMDFNNDSEVNFEDYAIFSQHCEVLKDLIRKVEEQKEFIGKQNRQIAQLVGALERTTEGKSREVKEVQ